MVYLSIIRYFYDGTKINNENVNFIHHEDQESAKWFIKCIVTLYNETNSFSFGYFLIFSIGVAFFFFKSTLLVASENYAHELCRSSLPLEGQMDFRTSDCVLTSLLGFHSNKGAWSAVEMRLHRFDFWIDSTLYKFLNSAISSLKCIFNVAWT